MTQNTLKVTQRRDWGRTRFYPDGDFEKRLAAFAGTVTFTSAELEALREMGFDIDVQKA